MRATTSEVAAAVDGRVVGPEVTVDGLAIDSRELREGQLFVPVTAERDGHDFIDGALASGAAAYLTAREPQGGTAIVVANPAEELTALGHWARRRLPDHVVGITGSVGKTSTKDFMAAVFARRYRTTASHRSHNNELGVPLTLFNAPDDTEAAIVEMGARGIDHIADLCRIARPTVGVVTTVGLAHTELFGTLAEVVRAKGELVEALDEDGVAVLNADVPEVAGMADRTRARVLTFGFGEADVRAVDVRLDPELRAHLRLVTPWGAADARLEARGEHQVVNALAAATAALASQIPLEEIVRGLAEARLSPWRMELATAPGGALVLNDAYNANPSSVAAALRSLAVLDAPRRTAVLGPMAELGDHAPAEHRRISDLATDLGVRLIAVGAPDYGSGAEQVPDIEAALELLGPVEAGDAVLVKGSRVAGLERLAEALVSGG